MRFKKLKINLFKDNTIWLRSLLPSIGCFSILFLLSIILLALNASYTNQLKAAIGNEANNVTFESNILTYPISIVLVLFETIITFYLCFNYISWFMSYKMAFESRKKFNFGFFILSSVVVGILLLDAFIRIIYVFVGIPAWNVTNDSGNTLSSIDYSLYSVFGSFSVQNGLSIGNFGFNTIILFFLSLIGLVGFFAYWYFQKKIYVSEYKENQLDSVQDNFRKINQDKIKRGLRVNKKHKKLSIDNSIKVF